MDDSLCELCKDSWLTEDGHRYCDKYEQFCEEIEECEGE